MAKEPKKVEVETPQPTIFDRLIEPFPYGCVEWRAQTIARAGNSAMALAYIDARSVMARLDEAVGPQNWQDRYRSEGGRMLCDLSVRIDGEWVSKSDGSGDSNFEGEKGGISGAFKRAAVKWGIGRYLYDVDALWADCKCRTDKDGNIVKDKNGKPIFDEWTPAGLAKLNNALQRAPGPRATGKPFSVDKMLELIRAGKDEADLRAIFTAHWATIPKEYRKEVLEAKDIRSGVIARAAKLAEPKPAEPKPESEEQPTGDQRPPSQVSRQSRPPRR